VQATTEMTTPICSRAVSGTCVNRETMIARILIRRQR
jgi:hypothetical protein